VLLGAHAIGREGALNAFLGLPDLILQEFQALGTDSMADLLIRRRKLANNPFASRADSDHVRPILLIQLQITLNPLRRRSARFVPGRHGRLNVAKRRLFTQYFLYIRGEAVGD